jgi:hypothetical protein
MSVTVELLATDQSASVHDVLELDKRSSYVTWIVTSLVGVDPVWSSATAEAGEGEASADEVFDDLTFGDDFELEDESEEAGNTTRSPEMTAALAQRLQTIDPTEMREFVKSNRPGDDVDGPWFLPTFAAEHEDDLWSEFADDLFELVTATIAFYVRAAAAGHATETSLSV